MSKAEREFKFIIFILILIVVVPVAIAQGIYEQFGGGACLALFFVLMLVVMLLNRNNQKIIYRDGWSIAGSDANLCVECDQGIPPLLTLGSFVSLVPANTRYGYQ